MKAILITLLTEARKAVVAFAGAAASAALPLILAAVQTTSDGGSTITHDELTQVITAAIVAGVIVGLAVFGISNKPAPVTPPPANVP